MHGTQAGRRKRVLYEEGETKIRNKFTKEEDDKLIALVGKFGESAWPELAKHMEGRSTRQCRDRWTQYLSPSANNSEWTQDEDTRLMRLYNEIGPRWAIISKYFDGRTNSCVRNRAVYLIRNLNKTISVKKNQQKGANHEEMSSPSSSPGNSRPPEVESVNLQPKILKITKLPLATVAQQIKPPKYVMPKPKNPKKDQPPQKTNKDKWKEKLHFQISTFEIPILPVSNFSNSDFETSIYQ